MKLGLSEKQYGTLLTVLHEQPESPSSEPEKGTSDKQGGGQGYPEVTKWESGIERGPANQTGVTKWSDVVGTKLTRGKANPLTEQNDIGFDRRYGTVDAAEKSNRENKELVNWVSEVTNWDEWGQLALTVGSIAAAVFIPGAQGLGVAAGLDLLAAADQFFVKKDKVGGAFYVILSSLPLIGHYTSIGKVTSQTAMRLANYFKNAKSETEVINIMKSLPKQDRYLVQKLVKESPERIGNIVTKIAKNNITTKERALEVVTQINQLIKTKQLDKVRASSLFKNLSLQNFGFYIGVSTGLIYVEHQVKKVQTQRKIMGRPLNPEEISDKDVEY
jgi:hypothetical protein